MIKAGYNSESRTCSALRNPKKQKITNDNSTLRLDYEFIEAVHFNECTKFSEYKPAKLYHSSKKSLTKSQEN